MPLLDLHTVVLLLIVGNLSAAAMALAYQGNAGSQGAMRLFVLSKLLQTIGWMLIGLRGEIPLWLSAHVGNPLIMGGFAIDVGLLNQPWQPRSRINLLLAAVVALGSLLLWMLGTTPVRLVAISGTTTALIYAAGGATVLTSPTVSRLQRLTGVLFLIFAPTMMLRVAYSLSTGAGLQNQNGVQSLTFLVHFSFLMIGALAFLLLAKEADDRLLRGSELREHERLRLQGQFMDMLTHELRAALSVIKLAGGALRCQLAGQPPTVLGRLDAIQSAGDAMAGVIERCIQLDRLERHDQPVIPETCLLAALIDSRRARLGRNAGRLVIDVPPGLAAWADRHLLGVMLDNLLDNAVKYSSPDSPVTLTASTTRSQPGLTIAVRNHVDARAQPDAAQLFRRYYRGPAAHAHTGTGLGLYLVRGLARLQGGDARHQHGADGQFELWLDLAAAEATPA